ncbi:hypothetical protein GLO73106DRAFT_00033380 [Gloeocapsa sp. PCC 73106]|nr:hypothetical protein GLO73106DRAFT_00033380 [Gloeocapsa sp. PCC 73106]
MCRAKLSLIFTLVLFVCPAAVSAQIQASELNCIIPQEQGVKNAHIPGMWWAKEQFDPFDGELIQYWVVRPELNSIDLIINRQLWTVLDYINRYRLVNQMGTVARESQYNLRLVTGQNKCLAFYYCDFSDRPYQCRIDFNSEETNGLELED